MGKRIPEDISVVGFDNIDICERQTPPLTSVDFNPRTVAVAAASFMKVCKANGATPVH